MKRVSNIAGLEDPGKGERSLSFFAYAIFTGASPKDSVDTYEEAFRGTGIRYRFNTFKITDQKESDLLRSNNPFALVALIAKTAFTSCKRLPFGIVQTCLSSALA